MHHYYVLFSSSCFLHERVCPDGIFSPIKFYKAQHKLVCAPDKPSAILKAYRWFCRYYQVPSDLIVVADMITKNKASFVNSGCDFYDDLHSKWFKKWFDYENLYGKDTKSDALYKRLKSLDTIRYVLIRFDDIDCRFAM